MSDAIERAAQVIWAAIERQADVVANGMHLDVQGVLTPHWIAEALATNGLLAPAPLREEWRIWGEDDDGEWEMGRDFESREEAEQFITENPWVRDRRGSPVRRLLSDWLPVDPAEGDGRAEK